MDMPAIIRRRRGELGISQAELADRTGITSRQVARYESGEQQPVLNVAVRIAEALSISLEELAGQLDNDLDLAGEWWAGWETFKDGQVRHAIQKVEANHHGRHVNLSAERTVAVEEGGYNWIGELSLWDGQALMGWYRGVDGTVQSKGTMYFALDRNGDVTGRGRWVGMSYDGDVITGNSSLARTEDEAAAILNKLTGSAS